MKALAVLAGLIAIGAPASAAADDLGQAVASARAGNPRLAAVSADGDAARARLSKARAARGPTVSLNAMAAQGRNDLDGFFGFDAADVTPSTAAIEAVQPLFASGALDAGVAGAVADRRRAEQILRAAEAELTVAVAQAYANVRLAEQGLETARRQAGLMAEIARQAAERFEAGEIARSDYAEATARRVQATAGLALAQSSLEGARAEYRRLVGRAPSALAPLPDLPELNGDLDAYLAAAAASSPDIAAAEAAADAARASVRRARAGFGPQVALTARAARVRDEFFPGYSSDEWRVGLQGRWVLFDSGSTAASVSEQVATARGAEAMARATRDAVEARALSAYHTDRSARLRQVAAIAALEASAIAARSVSDEVDADQRPLVDRLDAETRLADAERARAEADRDALVALCSRQAVLGDATCAGLAPED
ncbi:TolC family protein [Brevundimonas sp.]|uniref:TolC family protein n=1 Tax=Brevundimonas sp. TaxID=1871086 RepID=UPI0017D418BE|nr:TolC family protein [Brevundimonas sp.]MBA4806918.1 TolC family protein [Brevundimonas sp.]